MTKPSIQVLIPKQLQKLVFGCAKAPGLSDRKGRCVREHS